MTSSLPVGILTLSKGGMISLLRLNETGEI